MERVWQIAGRSGIPGPKVTQPPYSLVSRAAVEYPAMQQIAAERQIVASYTLAAW
jgi:hypothetical protein